MPRSVRSGALTSGDSVMWSRRAISFSTVPLLVAGSLLMLVSAAGPAHAGTAAVPRPDHIVIVVEENHSDTAIMANPSAPYINALANSGANFTQSYAETHPSQPNYLDLFSGASQGVTTDSCPNTFTADNLGSELGGAGLGFAGYSETLPGVGYTGCTSGQYVRKHAPWVNFSNIAASANQPFTAFPSDYSTLPAVSFVIPNQDNDMHDGTIAQGDAWLQTNMASYVSWAQTHNSLFVLTFDENEGGGTNRIPTIITGQRVVSGTYPEVINHYSMLRTIQDAYGLAPLGASASASPILDIWTPPSGDQPPVAAFTSSCTNLACTFDASSSTDPDGTVTGYSWTFGDGGTTTGATPTHAYSSAGSYSVQVTVADNQGATSSTVHAVTVTAPAGTPFASDAFRRSVSGGWGQADVGGAWTRSGAAAAVSVTPGQGVLRLDAGATLVENLNSVAQTDADVLATFSIDRVPIGASTYVTVSGRRMASANYQAMLEIKPSGATVLRLVRLASGAQTTLGQLPVPGLTVTSGHALSLRLQVTGTSPTAIRARTWPAGASEPGQWQLTASDATAALQANGAVGISAYLPAAATNAPVSLSVTSYVASSTAPPANQPPVAVFSSSCTQLTCTVDASGSADPEGTIASYAWTFDDGDIGTGATAAHTYGSASTYLVTLTVADNVGATTSISHSVAPSSSSVPIAFVAAAHGPAGSVKTEQLTVPSNVQVGDTMLLFFTYSATASWTGPTGGTGWTQLSTFTNSSIISVLWQKTAANGDAGNVVRLDSTVYTKGALQLAVYRGVGSTTPVLAHAGDAATSTHVSPTISAPAGSLVVSEWADKSETTTGWTAPAGVSTRDVALGSGGGRYCALLADSGSPVNGGSYGGLTASTNAASSRAVEWTVALISPG